MANIRKCMAGQNKDGKWHIACDEPAMGCLGILQNMRYTGSTSHQSIHYDRAAIHIRDRRGTNWTTNALGEYTNVAGIPNPPRG